MKVYVVWGECIYNGIGENYVVFKLEVNGIVRYRFVVKVLYGNLYWFCISKVVGGLWWGEGLNVYIIGVLVEFCRYDFGILKFIWLYVFVGELEIGIG